MEQDPLSEERMNVAKTQIQILDKIYKNLSSEGFDTDLDLSSFNASEIDDFWLYTAGLLFTRNFDKQFDGLSNEEIQDISDGIFTIKNVTPKEEDELLKLANAKIPKGSYSPKVPLFSVQDGTYYLWKNRKLGLTSRKPVSQLVLQTNPINLDRFYSLNNSREIIKYIRNLFIHDTPFVNGSDISFVNGNGIIQVTKMWLRGFSEMYATKRTQVDAKEIENILEKELPLARNYIETEKEIDQALSLIKGCFPEEIVKNYSAVTTFVKKRIQYSNFYKMSLDDKIKFLSAILTNNEDFLTTRRGSSSPNIVYNLQTLVNNELRKRELGAAVAGTYEEEQELRELKEKIEELDKKYDEIYNKPLKTNFDKMTLKNLRRDIPALIRKYNSLIDKANNRRKLESSNSEIFEIPNLDKLPIEVAVNLIAMMGYNQMVTSAFYDDVLQRIDFANFTPEQNEFFGNFNTNGITISSQGNIISDFSPSEIAELLIELRHAIVHGQVKFILPYAKPSKNVNYKDVVMLFPRKTMLISGTVDSFYKFFMNNPFTFDRQKVIDSMKEVPLTYLEKKRLEFLKLAGVIVEKDENQEEDENQEFVGAKEEIIEENPENTTSVDIPDTSLDGKGSKCKPNSNSGGKGSVDKPNSNSGSKGSGEWGDE